MKLLAGQANTQLLKLRASGATAVPTAQFVAMNQQIAATTTKLNGATAATAALGKKGKASLGVLTGSFVKLRSTIFFTLFILAGLALAFKNTLGQAAAATETANLVGVAFGELTDQAIEWADRISGGILDTGPLLKTAAVFNDMARAMGIVNDQALIMSQNLTQLSYDYASLYDTSFETAATKFQSAFAGQTKAIRSYGLDITQASLQAEIYAEGLNYKISELHRASKAVLIHNSLVRQSTRAHGDLARTVTSPANMMKVLGDAFRLAGRAIGYLFLPMLKAVLPWLLVFAQGVLAAARALGAVFGIKIPSWKQLVAEMGSAKVSTSGLADNMGKTEKAAKGAAKAAKQMRDYSLGIDELNILKPETPSSGGGGGAGAGGGGLGGGVAPGIEPLPVYDFGNILEDLEKQLAPIKAFFRKIGDAVRPFVKTWKENFKNLWAVLSPIIKRLWTYFSILWNKYLAPFVKFLLAVFDKAWDAIVGTLKVVWAVVEPLVDLFLKWFDLEGDKFSKTFDWLTDMVSNLDVTGFFNNLADKVRKAQKIVGEKFKEMKKNLKDAVDGMKAKWDKFVMKPVEAVTEYVRNGWEKTKEAWDTAKKWVSSTVKKTIEGIKKGWDGVVTAWATAKAWVSSTVKKTIEGVKKGWDKVVTAWDTAKKWVSDTVIKSIKGFVSDTFKKTQKAWDGIKSKTSSLGVSIKAGALAALNRLIHGYNRASAAAANLAKIRLPAFKDTNGNYGIPLSTKYINFMAQGGMPSRGSMFVAGEAGPELMGSFGGNSNTVMPLENSGFVEAMAKATYGAMTSALAGLDAGGDGSVYLDGQKVGSVLRASDRRSGVSASLVKVSG
jgi:hypothetical protein